MNASAKRKIKNIIRKCKGDCGFFIDNFCKVKHPNAGIIPFHLFSYQHKCLSAFRDHRFTIFGKTRQCGISTLSGAYALWIAMMFRAKTILVTSKTDRDAKEFLNKNIKFVYNELPSWMQLIWRPSIQNEHELGFSNGSKIKSLPSGPEVLRQYSSTLNIIDEAAFCKDMKQMWASGSPTLQHGGSVIVISTSNGVGNWYWETWTDALEGQNSFHPIVIDWWDMDWAIEYIDEITQRHVRISPTDDIRECVDENEKDTYGPYVSPWLEQQYRELTSKGNSNKFRQEVLRDFLGSGNTVLSREQLLYIRETLCKDHTTPDGMVQYNHPITEHVYNLDFQDRLWIWEEPQPGHVYTMGVDIATGEAHDWSAIEVFDLATGCQVAELQIKETPKQLAAMADYIGRWYNMAFMVPERTGIGVSVCQELMDMAYPSLFKKGMMPSADKKIPKNTGHVGFATTGQGKPIINKALIDNLGRDGFEIKSMRLSKQLETYVHLGAGRTGAEKGSMNDDMVIAAGLAFIGMNWAVSSNNSLLVPYLTNGSVHMKRGNIEEISTDFSAPAPIISRAHGNVEETADMEIQRFTNSLLSPISDSQIVSHRKHQLPHKKH